MPRDEIPKWVNFGGLFKDKRGRVHYFVAWDRGHRFCFFVNGRRPIYHEHILRSKEEFDAIFTKFEPPPDTTPIQIPVGFDYSLRNNLSVHFGAFHQNGWHGIEVGDYPRTRWYLVSASWVQKHVVWENRGTKRTRFDVIRFSSLV
jgi:hypothetical protein